LIENTAKRGDLHVQIVVLNNCCRPHGGDDLVPRKEIARPTEQYAEHVERTPADFDWNRSGTFVPPEQAVPVETEALEQKNVGREGRFQASASLALPNFENILAEIYNFLARLCSAPSPQRDLWRPAQPEG
jgi:hypothetical protein